MRRHAFALLAILVLSGPLAATWLSADATPRDSAATIVVLVRHAEKNTAMAGHDVPLTAAGMMRAQELARALGDTKFGAIYVTPYLRNRQTAQPLATRRGDTLTVVDAVDETVRRLLTQHAGETVCVVGHSNTVPQIIEQLTGVQVPPYREGEYDRLYVVTLTPGRPATLLRLNYGPPNPAQSP